MRRATVVLTVCGVAMLLGMAVLHASGTRMVADMLVRANVSVTMQQVLPVLYLYPSVLFILLSGMAIVALRWWSVVPFLLGGIAVIVAANGALGFYLGGWLPGVITTVAAAFFALAASCAQSTEQSR
ncbi:MAG: hypothetical protein AAGH76_17790 [Pseudomonadota bacterium]